MLVNPRSGSVPEDAEQKLRDALEGHGEKADFTLLDGDDIASPIQACLESSPDMIIVWSGDGTVACALEKTGPSGPPILPLPGGTMNLFHKQIHGGACEWDHCLERGLKKGRQIDVPAGRAGDRNFYVAAMAGNLTDFAAPREAIRKGRLLEAIQTLSGSDALDLRTTMTFRSESKDDKVSEGYATAAPSAFTCANAAADKSNAVTAWPAFTRLMAIGPPILPKPINATFAIFAPD